MINNKIKSLNGSLLCVSLCACCQVKFVKVVRGHAHRCVLFVYVKVANLRIIIFTKTIKFTLFFHSSKVLFNVDLNSMFKSYPEDLTTYLTLAIFKFQLASFIK